MGMNFQTKGNIESYAYTDVEMTFTYDQVSVLICNGWRDFYEKIQYGDIDNRRGRRND